MFIAVSGIGVLAYTLTSLTALVVEGELTKSPIKSRRRMEKMARNYEEHYTVCGIEKTQETFQKDVFIEGGC